MMGIEEQLLSASIGNTLDKAYMAQYDLAHLQDGLHTVADVKASEEDDRMLAAEDALEFYLEKAFRDILILAERLGLRRFAKLVEKTRSKITHLTELSVNRFDVSRESLPLRSARDLYDSLAAMTLGRAVSGLGIFETMLENTPHIIEMFDATPSNEAQVRGFVRQALSLSFRDVVREIPLPTNIKTYRPDIGIRSLMAAAEYKYVDTREKAKKSMGEIYEDMRGYSGKVDWRSFYAVFYMTEPFYTQKDVEAEFRLVRAELSWTPIVVVGRGGPA